MADDRPGTQPGRSERFIRLQNLIKATRKGNISEIRELIKAGVSVNCTAGGVTALHVAAAHDHVDCAEFLLENSGKVNQTIADLVTPLHVAVRFESLACVVLFTSRGADVNAVNKEGWAPLHMAARNGNAKSAEILIFNGANIEAPLKPRNTRADELYSLHFAARHGHANCIEVLLKNGVNMNRQTGKSLMTALHLTIQHKHLGCAYLLLTHRASTSIADFNGNLPIHLICKNRDLEFLELLLQAGATADYFNNKGKKPVDLAIGPVRTLLESLNATPKRLTFFCVQVIRRSLHAEGCPKPLSELASSLPLPKSIKNMVAMKTVVEVIKDINNHQ